MRSLTLIPEMLVEVDGAPLAPERARTLTQLRVRQELSSPTLCELTFVEDSHRYEPPFEPGQALGVRIVGPYPMLFTGDVTAVESVYGPDGGREVLVRGYDRLHRLRKRQTVRGHVQTTLCDLAEELAGAVGLSIDAELRGPEWATLIQHRQTDLELLVSLAERYGLFLSVREDTLHLLTLEGIGAPVPLVLGDSLLEVRIDVNGDPACRSVSAVGWDPQSGDTRDARAKAARVGRRIMVELSPERLGGNGKIALVDESTPDTDHAEGLAQGELDCRVAREVTLWGVTEGNPWLRPGTPVEVAGVSPTLTGRYILTAVTHTVDSTRGFVSEISTMPPRRCPRDRTATATVGEVTSVDDPDGIGRIRVKLPTFAGVETDWIQVVAPGGGTGKGLVTLPDVGDRVLVLLAHADPGEGIVLGGLYGTGGPPDSGVEGKAVRRYTLVTPGGNRLTLDDHNNIVRLEDATGSYVELSPEKVVFHSAADLTFEAPGRAVLIRGKSVDFESAP